MRDRPPGLTLRSICCCVALSLVAGNAFAQQFPNKVVRVINPAAPGGNSDIFFRLLSPKMGEILGQQLVIDYRPGAGGRLGADLIAKSPPDGYTTGIVAEKWRKVIKDAGIEPL